MSLHNLRVDQIELAYHIFKTLKVDANLADIYFRLKEMSREEILRAIKYEPTPDSDKGEDWGDEALDYAEKLVLSLPRVISEVFSKLLEFEKFLNNAKNLEPGEIPELF